MENRRMLPFKSIAATLLFCVVLGPVGLLYSSVIGGVIMTLLGCLVLSSGLIIPIIFLWLTSCIWGVVAANKYNNRLVGAAK